MQGGTRDPATPWFDAAQDRVPDSPAKDPDGLRAIRRAVDEVRYPATRDDVVAAVEADPRVTADQATWVASSLPARAFRSAEEVVAELATFGRPPRR